MCRLSGVRWAMVPTVILAASVAFGQDDPRQIRATTRPGVAAPAASQPTTGPTGRLTVDPNEMDFGTVWQGAAAKHDFTVKNVGEGPLTIAVTTSCGCTVATKPKSPLAPGESDKFTVTYDSRRPGEAHKVVTLTTNDPTRLSVPITVKGTVKPLFALTPAEHITFQGLDMKSVASESLKMENRYDRPLKLKLKDGEDHGKFEVSLKEVKPGSEYELTATSKPPLDLGMNKTVVTLETDVADLPPLTVMVSAYTQPRVFLSPFRLSVNSASSQPTQQTVQVFYRVDTPVKIREAKSDIPGVKAEVLPEPSQPQGSKQASWQIRVTLPPFDQIPEAGGKLEVFTDDTEAPYDRLEVPIGRMVIRPPAPGSRQPGQKPGPAQVPPPTPPPPQ